MKIVTWQFYVTAGTVLALTVLSFINAGVFAFLAAMIAFVAGTGLGVIVGAEGGRRDSTARVRHLEEAYATAQMSERTSRIAQAEAARKLAETEEQLRQSDAERIRLRALLDEREDAEQEAVTP